MLDTDPQLYMILNRMSLLVYSFHAITCHNLWYTVLCVKICKIYEWNGNNLRFKLN